MDFGWVVFAVLSVIAVIVLSLAVTRVRAGTRGGSTPAAGRWPVSRETSVAASRMLTPEVHSEVYGFIARGNRLAAVQAFRRHTRLGLRNCAVAVESMEKFPQPYSHPGADG